MAKFTATVATANFRDIDGCDSDAAVKAIMAAIRQAAETWAKRTGYDVTVNEYSPARDRRPVTIVVHNDFQGDWEQVLDLAAENDNLDDCLSYAMDRAIESGDWEA
jgi:hypothetical protein